MQCNCPLRHFEHYNCSSEEIERRVLLPHYNHLNHLVSQWTHHSEILLDDGLDETQLQNLQQALYWWEVRFYQDVCEIHDGNYIDLMSSFKKKISTLFSWMKSEKKEHKRRKSSYFPGSEEQPETTYNRFNYGSTSTSQPSSSHGHQAAYLGYEDETDNAHGFPQQHAGGYSLRSRSPPIVDHEMTFIRDTQQNQQTNPHQPHRTYGGRGRSQQRQNTPTVHKEKIPGTSTQTQTSREDFNKTKSKPSSRQYHHDKSRTDVQTGRGTNLVYDDNRNANKTESNNWTRFESPLNQRPTTENKRVYPHAKQTAIAPERGRTQYQLSVEATPKFSGAWSGGAVPKDTKNQCSSRNNGSNQPYIKPPILTEGPLRTKPNHRPCGGPVRVEQHDSNEHSRRMNDSRSPQPSSLIHNETESYVPKPSPYPDFHAFPYNDRPRKYSNADQAETIPELPTTYNSFPPKEYVHPFGRENRNQTQTHGELSPYDDHISSAYDARNQTESLTTSKFGSGGPSGHHGPNFTSYGGYNEPEIQNTRFNGAYGDASAETQTRLRSACNFVPPAVWNIQSFDGENNKMQTGSTDEDWEEIDASVAEMQTSQFETEKIWSSFSDESILDSSPELTDDKRRKSRVTCNFPQEKEIIELEQPVEIAEEAQEKAQIEILDIQNHFNDDLTAEDLQECATRSEYIGRVRQFAETLDPRVETFKGTNYCLEYFILDEKLMKLVEHLDKLNCQEEPPALKEKLDTIAFIKKLHSKLDARVEE